MNKIKTKVWISFSELSKNLNMTMSYLRNIMIENEMIENAVISTSYGLMDEKFVKKGLNTAYIPTDKSFRLNYVKKKPNTKHKGRRGPWVWNLHAISLTLTKR